VEVVPPEDGVVAGGAVDVDVVGGGVELVGVVCAGVLEVVLVLVDVLELVVGVVVLFDDGLHCWLASCPTVETPWSRFWRSVGLTVAGSAATERARLTVVFDTVEQSPD
jgi:hypothetical protein